MNKIYFKIYKSWIKSIFKQRTQKKYKKIKNKIKTFSIKIYKIKNNNH